MHLLKQVISQETAKKLKELGVNKPSYYVWFDGVLWNDDAVKQHYSPEPLETYTYSAYSVAELGEMLPRYTITQQDNQEWIAEREWYEDGTGIKSSASTEVEARAGLLIQLLEKNIIDPVRLGSALDV